jgi:hypothetical protein
MTDEPTAQGCRTCRAFSSSESYRTHAGTRRGTARSVPVAGRSRGRDARGTCSRSGAGPWLDEDENGTMNAPQPIREGVWSALWTSTRWTKSKTLARDPAQPGEQHRRSMRRPCSARRWPDRESWNTASGTRTGPTAAAGAGGGWVTVPRERFAAIAKARHLLGRLLTPSAPAVPKPIRDEASRCVKHLPDGAGHGGAIHELERGCPRVGRSRADPETQRATAAGRLIAREMADGQRTARCACIAGLWEAACTHGCGSVAGDRGDPLAGSQSQRTRCTGR